MSQPALKAFHEQQLIRPVLRLRLRPFWSRMLRVPALYRQYRLLGLLKWDAFRLAFLVLRSPRMLGRIQQRWGTARRRRG